MPASLQEGSYKIIVRCISYNVISVFVQKPGHDALASLQMKGGQVTVPIVRVGGVG